MSVEPVTVGRVANPGHVMPLWHNPEELISPDLDQGTRFRLVFVHAGSALLDLKGRQRVLLAPALLCLNETERPTLRRSRGLRSQAIYFHPSVTNGYFDSGAVRSTAPSEWTYSVYHDDYLMSAFLDRGPTADQVISLGPATVQQVTRLFEAIGSGLELQPDRYWPCRTRSYLLELLSLVARMWRPEPQHSIQCTEPALGGLRPAPGSEEIEELLLYLHTHYSEKIALDQICREFHSNRTTLSERFRSATGLSIMNYLAQLRIRVAELMLRDTMLPVSEVAIRTGFGDLTHFGRAFRSHAGATPSDYRKRNCWMVR